LAGPLDQSPLAFKELVYGRLIRVFAGKNHGEAVMFKLLLVFHRHIAGFRRRQPAPFVFIARPPRPDLALALLQIGAQLRRKAFNPVSLAFGLALFGGGHNPILASAAEN
jgi:hypothetical protein